MLWHLSTVRSLSSIWKSSLATAYVAFALTLAAPSVGTVRADVLPLADEAQRHPVRIQLHQAMEAEKPDTITKLAPAETDRRIAVVNTEIARLRASGDVASADRMSAELARRTGKAVNARVEETQPELHVVGVYEGASPPDKPDAQRGHVAVKVTVSDRPVVLVLCAYEWVLWNVQLAEGARIERVILSGREVQEVEGVPENVPILKSFSGAANGEGHFAYSLRDESFRKLLTWLQSLTSMDIATFQGSYRPDAEPFVVGSENAAWLAERNQHDLEPLYLEAIAHDLAKQREPMRELSFEGLWPAQAAPANAPGPFRSHTFRKLSPLGPLGAKSTILKPGTQQAVVDEPGGRLYEASRHALFATDLATGQSTSIAPDDPNLPKLELIGGIALDAKRQRLIVATISGNGNLFSYDTAAKKWSNLGNLRGIDFSGLAYSIEDDCFYGVVNSHSDQSIAIIRLTSDGKPDALIRPSKQISTDAGPSPFSSPGQIVAVGANRVAVVMTPSARRDPRNERQFLATEPARCYMIECTTGNVVYSGAMFPQSDDGKAIAIEALDAAWRGLDGDDAESNILAWLSGGGTSVDYLRAELLAPEANIDPATIQALIGQLGHDDQSMRNDASRTLRRLGQGTMPMLRTAAEKEQFPEVSTRITELLDTPKVVTDRRVERATVVLSHIGTPAAIDLLRELTNSTDPLRAEAALKSMRTFAAQ